MSASRSTRRARLAFLTLEDRQGFVIDDALAIEELGRRGLAVDEVPWRRPVDWRAWDAVVVRTPWDYQHDLAGFLAVLDAIVAAGVRVANPPALIRWNAHKTYLRELAGAGVATVPTRWGQGITTDELRAIGEGHVLKPVVGANADDTYRLDAGLEPATAVAIAARFADRPWMLQPFVPSIVTEGEHSLFFFGGAFSHAIVKRPAPGDFRVQEEHGGEIRASTPAVDLRAAADQVLAALVARADGAAPLQARVDLVRLDDGTPALMELEAIEPSLYFRMHPDAPRRFADAVEAWLDAG